MLWRCDRRFSKNTEAFMRFLKSCLAETMSSDAP